MKKICIGLLVGFMLMALFGCGRLEDAPLETKAEADPVRWKTEGFALTGGVEEEQSLYAGEYLPWEHGSSGGETAQLSRLDFGVCGKAFWYLGREWSQEPGAKAEYTMENYDTVSGELTVKRFSPEELGLEGKLGLLYGMDRPDEGTYVFRWVDFEQDESGLYRQSVDEMIYTDFAGSLKVVDLRETYLEKEIYQEEFTEQPVPQFLNWRCDGAGNICVIDYREDGAFCFYLFDQNGESLLESEGTAEQWLVEPLRTPEGDLIFPVYTNEGKGYEFLWADAQGRKLRSLGRMETSYPDIRRIYGMLGDAIYYRSQEIAADGIVKWDVKSGRRERVLDLQAAGIGTGYEIVLALRERQTPVLHLEKTKEGKRREWIAALTEQKAEDDSAIRVADLVAYGQSKAQVASCAVLASVESPGFRYEYEDLSAQESRDRIFIELSQGKGPDLLFVSLEDMYLLEEKGLLLDIGELIPEELREEILPGALETGTIDGKVFGVPVRVQADTFVVASDTWPEDTWRLEDVIDLMAEGKLTGAFRTTGMYTEPPLTVLTLVNKNLADSFLIDWENRKSHFDDERFIRLLEVTGTDMRGVPTNPDAWLNEGKDIYWKFFYNVSDFLDFFEELEAEGGRIVGYPTEDACGSYLTAEGGVLVVNANIAKRAAAADFLEILLGEEAQAKTDGMCMSVRRLVPEDYIVEEESGRLLFMGNSRYEVPTFQDGTTSLHRAKAFLESCAAAPRHHSWITQILVEELNAMYAENRPPETTAGIINSRVQIYLDEEN